jgi:hypothetical protein
MWDLWWKKWQWARFFSEFFGFPLSIYHSIVALQTHIIRGIRNMLTKVGIHARVLDPPHLPGGKKNSLYGKFLTVTPTPLAHPGVAFSSMHLHTYHR